jgi:hypothetical protein
VIESTFSSVFVCSSRFLVSEFITPLKQAGTIVQYVGKAVGQPAAEQTGKFVAQLMDEPEEKMKKVIKTTTAACNRVSASIRP